MAAAQVDCLGPEGAAKREEGQRKNNGETPKKEKNRKIEGLKKSSKFLVANFPYNAGGAPVFRALSNHDIAGPQFQLHKPLHEVTFQKKKACAGKK